MKIFLLIGWRNLWRNKRRSLVVIMSIAIGIFAMILSMGIMNGFNNQMVENTIATSLGHISINIKGFQDEIKPEKCFQPSRKLVEALKQSGAGYTPRLRIEGMLRSSESSRGVMITGIDPVYEKNVSRIYEYMIPGKEGGGFLTDPSTKEMLISTTLAEKMDVRIGDRVVLMFQNLNHEIVGTAFRVKGLFQSPIDAFDKYVVFVGIDVLGEIIGIPNQMTEIILKTKNRKVVDSVAKKIKAAIVDPDLEVLTWKELAPNLVRSVELFDQMMYVFFSIIFITVVFSIANTLIMAVLERFREIGVMKCIGTRPSAVAAMVIFEAVNLGIVGLFAGILPGAVVTFYLSRTGIDFSTFMESVRLWGAGFVIYPSIKPMDIIVSVSVVLVTTIVAAGYPAIKAARIKPLDALHFI